MYAIQISRAYKKIFPDYSSSERKKHSVRHEFQLWPLEKPSCENLRPAETIHVFKNKCKIFHSFANNLYFI